VSVQMPSDKIKRM